MKKISLNLVYLLIFTLSAVSIIHSLGKRHIQAIEKEESQEFTKIIQNQETPEVQKEPKSTEVSIPIIMYHRVSVDNSILDTYTIAPDEFESDLEYLKNHGYQAVTMTDLINFVYQGTILPDNPIVLTFDDGRYSDYLYVFPLLKKYEMKAVISIIGKMTDDYSAEGRQDINYPHLIWSQIEEMLESGLVDIQNHSYDLHSGRGVEKSSSETVEEYRLRLSKDLSLLQDRIYEMTGTRPNTFTYPFGKYSKMSEEILHDLGFSASLNCEERMNVLKTGDAECLFRLGRFLRPHGKSLEKIFKEMGMK